MSGMKTFLFFILVSISLFSFSKSNDPKKDLASDEEKIEMKKVFVTLINEMKSYKNDFSILVLDTLKSGKIKEIRVEKLWTSGDPVSYSMMIGIADQAETLSIICNRTPKEWFGYKIERSVGYAKDRYQEGYVNSLSELDSLLIPIRREFALVKEYKEKEKELANK